MGVAAASGELDGAGYGVIGFIGVLLSGMLLWLRTSLEKKMDDMRTDLNKNTALLVVHTEVLIVRALQQATSEDMKSVALMLRQHFEEEKKP